MLARPPGGLGEPDEAGPGHGVLPELGVADLLDRDVLPAEADHCAVEMQAAVLPECGDFPVVHLDPGAQVVGEPGAVRS
jgi:hypothetical protein